VPVTPGAVILVAGPRLAGTTSVLQGLQRQLPSLTFVEYDERAPADRPTAVVFVVSAVAALLPSDCNLLDHVAARTDAVIGAVSKIDIHSGWRSALESNRIFLIGHHSRYLSTQWTAVAAAPDFGLPKVDELVAAVRAALTGRHLADRNRLRSELADQDAALDALRRQRRGVVRADQQLKGDRRSALSNRLQHARLQVHGCARERCQSASVEFRRGVDAVTRRTLPAYLSTVRSRAELVLAGIAATVSAHLNELERELGLPTGPAEPVSVAPLSLPVVPQARRLESRLTTLLGLSFGLGVVLMLGRAGVIGSPADLPAPWGSVGLVVSLVLGTCLGWWVARTRNLLQARVSLDRWVTDVAATLRAAAKEQVAARLLEVERRLVDAAAGLAAAEYRCVDERLARIDRELRNRLSQRARTEKQLAVLQAEFGRNGAIRSGDPR
jgi:hypothetical protein